MKNKEANLKAAKPFERNWQPEQKHLKRLKKNGQRK